MIDFFIFVPLDLGMRSMESTSWRLSALLSAKAKSTSAWQMGPKMPYFVYLLSTFLHISYDLMIYNDLHTSIHCKNMQKQLSLNRHISHELPHLPLSPVTRRFNSSLSLMSIETWWSPGEACSFCQQIRCLGVPFLVNIHGFPGNYGKLVIIFC